MEHKTIIRWGIGRVMALVGRVVTLGSYIALFWITTTLITLRCCTIYFEAKTHHTISVVQEIMKHEQCIALLEQILKRESYEVD